MSPFIISLLKEIAKAAIPIVASEIIKKIGSSNDSINVTNNVIGPISESNYDRFDQFDLDFIRDKLTSMDLRSGLNDLVQNGFKYNLIDRNGSRSIEITKGLKRLVINN